MSMSKLIDTPLVVFLMFERKIKTEKKNKIRGEVGFNSYKQGLGLVAWCLPVYVREE